MMDRCGTTRGADLEFHSVANVFPLMEAAELEELATDIREHGLREPIWLHPDGSILDGRNRFLACDIAGVEPRFQTWDGQGSLAAFVVSLNLMRRHLDAAQRSLVAAKLANLDQGRPQNKPANLPVSQADAATLMNVSERSVRSAKKVLDHGDPALVSAVESGEKSVHAAEQEIKQRKLPSASQAREVFKNEREKQWKSLWRAWLRASDTVRKRFTEHLEQSGAGEAGEAQLYALQNQWLSANDRVRKRFGKWLEAKHGLKLIQLPPARGAKS